MRPVGSSLDAYWDGEAPGAQAAEMARARAIAEDANQRVRRPLDYVSQAAFARSGIGGVL